jgi:hypothetical protein
MEMPGTVTILCHSTSADFSSNNSQMLTHPRKIEGTCQELASEHISFAVDFTSGSLPAGAAMTMKKPRNAIHFRMS